MGQPSSPVVAAVLLISLTNQNRYLYRWRDFCIPKYKKKGVSDPLLQVSITAFTLANDH